MSGIGGETHKANNNKTTNKSTDKLNFNKYYNFQPKKLNINPNNDFAATIRSYKDLISLLPYSGNNFSLLFIWSAAYGMYRQY